LDIKDFILIGGGILIALVVGHGFWIAWRAKREPLRLDIVPDLIPDDVDEMERLRGELPNGGARVVNRVTEAPDQQNLELDLSAPVLMEPAAEPPRKAPFDRPKKLRARVHQPAPADVPETGASEPQPAASANPELSTREPVVDSPPKRPQVREVELQTESIRGEKGIRTEKRKKSAESKQAPSQPQPEPAPVEELLIINVLAAKGTRFEGEGLVAALRKQGLRYGDMNIFHRIDPATKAKLYSVANAVEPGTFDLSDLSTMRSPGMTFFLQLPGPDDAGEVFDDMLQAARNVALDLGGDLRDEALSVLTGQTTEHMRQRIADFARRRLSKRA
jgi:cell division protein ZipA